MNILMMTNTFTPHVGGVARSVKSFTENCRRMGHRAVVVAPEYENMPKDEIDVIRIPALQHFNGSDFSVVLPIWGPLNSYLKEFQPDIVHSHHPFLMGSTAVRVAKSMGVPLVFTHHTMFEQYTHYVPIELPRMREFVKNLSTGYANMCDTVIAPSQSVAEVLKKRGVVTPITVIPTGIGVEDFATGDGKGFRDKMKISRDSYVVGHVGRLAPEKNLSFLAEAVVIFLKQRLDAVFMLAGYGPNEGQIREIFERQGLSERLYFCGKLQNQQLVDAYHAMDVFVFSSKSETQGMVLVEAMAAGVPVVALDAPGVREVVRDGINGYLLYDQTPETFAETLKKLASFGPEIVEKFRNEARKTAEATSIESCTKKLIELYEQVLAGKPAGPRDESVWHRAMEEIKAEWDLLTNLAGAALKQ